MPVVYGSRVEIGQAFPWMLRHFPACYALSLGGCPFSSDGSMLEIAHAHPSAAVIEGGIICFHPDYLATAWNPEKPTATLLQMYAHLLNYRRKIYTGHVWQWRSEYRRLLREWGWPQELLFNAWLAYPLLDTPEQIAEHNRLEDAGRYPDDKGPVTPDLGWWPKIKASAHSFRSGRRGLVWEGE